MKSIKKRCLKGTKSRRNVYVVQYHNLEYYKFYEIGNAAVYDSVEGAHKHAMEFIADHNRDMEDETQRYSLQRSENPPTEEEFSSDSRCYYVYTPVCALWVDRVQVNP